MLLLFFHARAFTQQFFIRVMQPLKFFAVLHVFTNSCMAGNHSVQSHTHRNPYLRGQLKLKLPISICICPHICCSLHPSASAAIHVSTRKHMAEKHLSAVPHTLQSSPVQVSLIHKHMPASSAGLPG